MHLFMHLSIYAIIIALQNQLIDHQDTSACPAEVMDFLQSPTKTTSMSEFVKCLGRFFEVPGRIPPGNLT